MGVGSSPLQLLLYAVGKITFSQFHFLVCEEVMVAAT